MSVSVNSYYTVSTVAELKALAGRPSVVQVLAGNGVYNWTEGNTTTGDDVTVIEPTAPTPAGRYILSVTDYPLTVENLAALKALTSRPESVLVQTGQAAGTWQWVSGSSTTADDALVVQCTAGAAGRYKRIYAGNVDVLWFGAKGDGTTESAAYINAAITALGAGGGTIEFDAGTYLLSSEIVVPDKVILAGAGAQATILKPSTNGLTVVHLTGSYSGVRDLGIDGNSKTTISALRVTPLSEVQTTTRVDQNYNRINNLVISGCAEAIVLQAGPDVAAADSGCWYNTFYNILIVSCTRGLWLKDGPNASSSGCNRNQFYSVRIGQSGANTGVQIDSGDTNSFFGCSFEGIASGTSPNTTPTAIKIAQNGTWGNANEQNRFFGAVCEACTKDLVNASAYSEFYGCYLSTFTFTATPKTMLGGYDASVVPQIAEWMLFQQDGQVSGYGNTALNLRQGQLAFPATQNPSSNVNVLDDYEEGSFVPTLNASGLSGATYATQVGRYVKIGKTVYVWAEVILSALTSGGTNYLRIDGLPFAVAVVDAPVTLVYNNLQGGVSGTQPRAMALVGQVSVNLIETNENGWTSAVFMSGARLTATTQISVQGSYQAAN